MSTSDTNNKSKLLKRTSVTYLYVSIFCLIFSLIYEHFSHGVYSPYMIYAFAIPLAGGCLPFLFLNHIADKYLPDSPSLHLHHFAIATLTIGSILQGILEIYGTTNQLVIYYLYIGVLELLASWLLYGVKLIKRHYI